MTLPRYIRTPDGKLVAVPTIAPSPVPTVEGIKPISVVPEPSPVPVPSPMPVPEEIEAEPRDDGFSEILDVTEEDIIGTEGVALPEEEDNEDLFGVPEEEDMGDLFGVSEPEEERPRPPKRRLIRRTSRPYYPPESSLLGPR